MSELDKDASDGRRQEGTRSQTSVMVPSSLRRSLLENESEAEDKADN